MFCKGAFLEKALESKANQFTQISSNCVTNNDMMRQYVFDFRYFPEYISRNRMTNCNIH